MASEETQKDIQPEPKNTANQPTNQPEPNVPIPPREQMVNAAASFLQNPRVRTSPLAQRQAFLSKKGLTDEEINLAIERAGIISTAEVASFPVQQLVPANNAGLAQVRHPSIWTQMYRTGSTFVVMGVAIYGLHQFYKSFIEPWLYAPEEKDSLTKLKEQMSDVHMALSELQQSVAAMERTINNPKTEYNANINDLDPNQLFNPMAFMEMRSDIATIKSLLLNRNQFPEVPKIYASIPSWQLPLNANEKSETMPKIKSKDVQSTSEKMEDDSKSYSGGIVKNDVNEGGDKAVVNSGSNNAIDMQAEVREPGVSQEVSPVEASTSDAHSVQTSTSSDFSIISNDVKSS